MDALEILEELRGEISDILSNYHFSLQQIQTKHKSALDTTDSRYIDMERKARYAILAYGTALQLVDALIREQTRQ